MPLAPSPFAPKAFPELPVVPGVRLASGNCGIRYKKRDDLMLAVMPEGTAAAGVFTQSSMPGVPVEWCKSILPHGIARALVVNSGISNVFTGEKGKQVVYDTVDAACELLGCPKDAVWVSSTGVIGVVPDADKICAKLPDLHANLSETAWEQAAHAILTTDTFPKASTRQAKIGDTTVTLNGIVKGSGMTAPNMATMLGYIFTDAKIAAPVLQQLLSTLVEPSFNSITVDSDTSTSDTVLLFATGQADHTEITDINDPALDDFKTKLLEVMLELAQLVVRDGEGISKFITVEVEGARDHSSARKIGLSIANSPLVKTAIAGEDANWGRIVMAIGKSGEPANRDLTSITVGNTTIAHHGEAVEGYDETPVAEYMKGREITIKVHVGIGEGKATVWTSDLTHGYIEINADYRT